MKYSELKQKIKTLDNDLHDQIAENATLKSKINRLEDEIAMLKNDNNSLDSIADSFMTNYHECLPKLLRLESNNRILSGVVVFLLLALIYTLYAS